MLPRPGHVGGRTESLEPGPRIRVSLGQARLEAAQQWRYRDRLGPGRSSWKPEPAGGRRRPGGIGHVRVPPVRRLSESGISDSPDTVKLAAVSAGDSNESESPWPVSCQLHSNH